MTFRFVLVGYEDPSAGTDWPEQTPAIIKRVNELLRRYPGGPLEFQVKESNHGRGADWPTITVSLITVAGVLLFGIPAAHKKLRETIEEWRKIKQNVDRVIAWIEGQERVVAYPVEVLFFDAVEWLGEERDVLGIELLDVATISDTSNPSPSLSAGYLFLFCDADQLFAVAIDCQRRRLMKRTVELPRERYKRSDTANDG